MSGRQKVEKRLIAERKQLEKHPISGISAAPKDNNLMEWEALIFDVEDANSPFKNKFLELRLLFTNDYPLRAPTVKFVTKMYHPNVDQDGTVHLDILSDKWSPTQYIGKILTTIKSLLSNPDLTSPINRDAALLYRMNPSAYNRRVIGGMIKQNSCDWRNDWSNNRNSNSQHNSFSETNNFKTQMQKQLNLLHVMILKKHIIGLKQLPEKDFQSAVKVLSHVFGKLIQDPNNPKFRDLNLLKIRRKSSAALVLLLLVGFKEDITGERLQFNEKNMDFVKQANDLLMFIKIPCNCRTCMAKRKIESLTNLLSQLQSQSQSPLEEKKQDETDCDCFGCQMKKLAQAKAKAKEQEQKEFKVEAEAKAQENRSWQLKRYQENMNKNLEMKDNSDTDNIGGEPRVVSFKDNNRSYPNSVQMTSPFSAFMNGLSGFGYDNMNIGERKSNDVNSGAIERINKVNTSMKFKILFTKRILNTFENTEILDLINEFFGDFDEQSKMAITICLLTLKTGKIGELVDDKNTDFANIKMIFNKMLVKFAKEYKKLITFNSNVFDTNDARSQIFKFLYNAFIFDDLINCSQVNSCWFYHVSNMIETESKRIKT